MADDPKEGAADSQPDESADTRISRLEAGQDSLTAKVDDILGILGGGGKGDGGDGHEAQPSGHGGSIAHEIRAQLDARDAKRQADADAKAKDDRLAAAETKLAELAEKPPAPMPRRVERWMGWR